MGFPSVCYCVILPQPLILVLQLLDLLRHAVLLGLSSLGLAAPPPPDDHPAAYYNNNNAADLWALHHPPAAPPPLHAQQQQQQPAAAAAVKALLPAVRYADLLLRSSSSPSRRASATTCCAVCLGALEARHRVRELGNCAHAFHKACIDKWVDKGHHTCPLCRAPLLPDHLASSSSGSSSSSF